MTGRFRGFLLQGVVGAFLLLGLPALAAGQEPAPPSAPPAGGTPAEDKAPAGAPDASWKVELPRLPSAPVIDGKLDDPAWQQARLLGGFVQDTPDAGQPATQKTEVRAGYDDRNLYFGFRCYDTEPEKIFAPVLQRDGDLSFDDSVYVILDTFHDRRNGFLFATNPLGVQVDGLVRNEGEEVSLEWDGLWQVATSRDAQGWTAEIAIPFKTLRFASRDPQSWGFNVFRFVARRKEESAWRPVLQEWSRLTRYKISQFGELEGLAGLSRAGRYSLIPYGLIRNQDQQVSGKSTKLDAGGDLKISLTSELVADLTVNTDFAEAEADQEKINLSRVKLFFPEKRQFFLEGANLFYFGDRITVFDPPEPFVFFFSRTIGLAANGEVPVPVLGGAKISGKVGDTSVGLLNLTTGTKTYVDDSGRRVTEPRTNYSVARLKTDLYTGSTLGIIALNKDPSGPGYNRGFGTDWALAFGPRLSSMGFLAKTTTPGLHGKDTALSADLVYKGPVLRLAETYKDFGDNFNPEMGFITRTGIKRSLTEASAIIVHDVGIVHQFSSINSFDYITDQRGRLQSQISFVEVGALTRTRSGAAANFTDDIEVLDTPLPLYKGVTLPPGSYRFRHLFIGYASDYSQKLGYTLWYDNGGFYDGHRLKTLVSLLYKPKDGFIISNDWEHDDVKLKEGDFTQDLIQTAADYWLSPRFGTRVQLQWNKQDNFRANFLMDWEYRPGSHLFFVYNAIRDLDQIRRRSGFSAVDPGRSLTLKLTRRLDF
ncbi:MAG TPA: DUF5916 domain-containing protein [Thermoanaerobaculia bacterium]|nr:DUF5916 domain-containing protein [Thermoanaerobaculia bacterium]